MISFNDQVPPMLGVLAKPFSSSVHSYEIKWDGFRAIAFLDPKEGVRLQSRNLKPLLPRFPTLSSLYRQVGKQMIIDGEIVSFVEGKPSFSALTQGQGQIVYLAFDLLWLEGKELLGQPLWRRQELLGREGGELAKSLPLDTDGLSALREAAKLGLEGIMAKERESLYLPGKRSKAWLKFKVRREETVVLGGYAYQRGLALLMGAWRGERLHYLGKVGTGFSQRQQEELIELCAQLQSAQCPFQPQPQGDYRWLKPVLTARVSYLELTEAGSLRQASWLGLSSREATGCQWEEFDRGL